MINLISKEFKELVISFPPNKFGFNNIAAKEYEENTPEKLFDKETAKKLASSPYPNLEFNEWNAILEDDPTVERPWTIDMVRKTRAYKNGEIIEPSDEIKRQQRISSGDISGIKPEDFNKKYKYYSDGFKAFQKASVFNTTEECAEFIGAMNEIVQIYDIVNVSVPKLKDYSKSHVAELKATQTLIAVAIEDFFIKGS